MFSKLLGLSIFLLPLSINVSAAYAQSWQDWSQQNPTYNTSPASPSKTVTPSRPAPSNSTQPRPPAQWSNPSSQPNGSSPIEPSTGPSRDNYLSTQNPLFEQYFMAGCQDSVALSICQCALREIQNNYTFNDVQQIVNFMQENGEIPSELIEIQSKCVPS